MFIVIFGICRLQMNIAALFSEQQSDKYSAANQQTHSVVMIHKQDIKGSLWWLEFVVFEQKSRFTMEWTNEDYIHIILHATILLHSDYSVVHICKFSNLYHVYVYCVVVISSTIYCTWLLMSEIKSTVWSVWLSKFEDKYSLQRYSSYFMRSWEGCWVCGISVHNPWFCSLKGPWIVWYYWAK